MSNVCAVAREGSKERKERKDRKEKKERKEKELNRLNGDMMVKAMKAITMDDIDICQCEKHRYIAEVMNSPSI